MNACLIITFYLIRSICVYLPLLYALTFNFFQQNFMCIPYKYSGNIIMLAALHGISNSQRCNKVEGTIDSKKFLTQPWLRTTKIGFRCHHHNWVVKNLYHSVGPNHVFVILWHNVTVCDRWMPFKMSFHEFMVISSKAIEVLVETRHN